MNKGFPRPRQKVANPKRTYGTDSIEGKEFPVPYTAKDRLTAKGNPRRKEPYDLANLSNERTIECVVKKVCIVCGDRVVGRKVWVYTHFGRVASDSGPFHEKCVRLTQNLCPAIKHAGTYPAYGRDNAKRFEFKEVYWSTFKPKILATQERDGFKDD